MTQRDEIPSDADVERWLADAPLRLFDAQREAELLNAIHATTPEFRWWERRIPLWQAAAACAALLLIAIGVARGLPARSAPASANEPGQAAPPVHVTLDAPLFARGTISARVDLAQWRTLWDQKVEHDHD